MKQVLLDLQSGSIQVENVPVPAVTRGVVVENAYSLISAGTESSLINLAQQSLIGKAKARPDDVKKVLQKIGTDGPLSAYQQAMSRLAKPEPLGYSCAGTVVTTASDDFEVGDRVACGGAGHAVHAEYVAVPKNLCVRIPDGVSFREAAFTTVGSIAMHGVRNARVTVGENVAVIGLGLIGLLSVQILKAAGCRVIGIDIDREKLALAANLGADVVSNYDGLSERMKAFSPFGADAVVITAATRSSAPVEAAGRLVRDKGRVVVVGNVGMDLPREIFYEKEAEVVVSRSYGPGGGTWRRSWNWCGRSGSTSTASSPTPSRSTTRRRRTTSSTRERSGLSGFSCNTARTVQVLPAPSSTSRSQRSEGGRFRPQPRRSGVSVPGSTPRAPSTPTCPDSP
ncbi:MAG: zinc-binding alcohol dehydrogenase [Methanoculleus sp.]|nr:zinc-binding alcohol dehydrogenase [Methanoculleus sp.]